MNKNRRIREIYTSFAAVVIINNLIMTVPIDAKEYAFRDSDLLSSNSNEYKMLDINGDFEDLHTRSDSFSAFWKDGIKPEKWNRKVFRRIIYRGLIMSRKFYIFKGVIIWRQCRVN